MPFRFSLRWLLIFTTYAVVAFAGYFTANPLFIDILAVTNFLAAVTAIVWVCCSTTYRLKALGFAIGSLALFIILFMFDGAVGPIEDFVRLTRTLGLSMTTHRTEYVSISKQVLVDLYVDRVRVANHVATMFAGIFGALIASRASQSGAHAKDT